VRAGFGKIELPVPAGVRLMGYANREGGAAGVHEPLHAGRPALRRRLRDWLSKLPAAEARIRRRRLRGGMGVVVPLSETLRDDIRERVLEVVQRHAHPDIEGVAS
jgi:hypothetical protein